MAVFLPPLAAAGPPPGSRQAARVGPGGVKQLPSADAVAQREVLASLRIKRDERYMNMTHYQENGGNNNPTSHFARLCKNTVEGVGPEVVDAAKIFSRIRELEEFMVNPDDVAGRCKVDAISGVQDRKEWQDNFERSIRRLMVDFDLSDVPAYRLKHLDRMYDWYGTNGSKQARMVQKGPNFLTSTRDGMMPPGSSKNVDLKQNETTDLLAKNYKMRRHNARGPKR